MAISHDGTSQGDLLPPEGSSFGYSEKDYVMFLSALTGDRGKDQHAIAEAGLRWISLILRKNSDYGSSVWKSPSLKPAMSIGDAIFVRMSDKIARIASLNSKETNEVKDESLADAIRDLGAYCLLWETRPLEE